MSYEVVEAKTFWDCAAAMQHDDRYHGPLLATLVELRRQPFKNPRLQTHDVGKAGNGKKIFSSDVGGRKSNRRLVWQLFNRTIVVLLYGTHAVQDRAKRIRVDFDPADQVITIYERAPDTGVERNYEQQRRENGRLFMAWTAEELAEFGFPEPTVEVLRGLDNDDELLRCEEHMAPDLFERAYNLVAHGTPDGTPPDEPEDEPEPEEPEVTEQDREIERELAPDRAPSWFTRVEPEFLVDVLGKPIEDWMIFLHPDQRGTVTRHYEGPARVRGAAGTGKTVVGLHRAAYLARRHRDEGVTEPILFTTFIKSLPPVFQSLYLRLPGTAEGEVDFVHIDRLASQICRDAGDRVRVQTKAVEAAFDAAYARIVTPGTPLGDGDFSKAYLREEITAVIKGRVITSLDTYLEIERTGRRAPLGRQQRTQVWELHTAWDEEMARRHTVDFPDVVVRARDHARRLTAPRYRSAIVDEAQDLTLAGLQLVRALVNAPDATDRPDGLLILGDGGQRIYAGGFKLRQAGVEVRGRTTVLRTNYRNTGEIIGTALAVAGEHDVDDLGEQFRRGAEGVATARSGNAPILIEAADLDGQLDEIVRRIREVAAHERVGFGDIGVLVPTNRLAQQVVGRLKRDWIEAETLDRYDGQPSDRVKVGTHHRGKGLEFKVVFLPGLSADRFPWPARDGQGPEELTELRERAVSQLYVAMTRARDLLVVLYDGEPSDVIADHLDAFMRDDA